MWVSVPSFLWEKSVSHACFFLFFKKDVMQMWKKDCNRQHCTTVIVQQVAKLCTFPSLQTQGGATLLSHRFNLFTPFSVPRTDGCFNLSCILHFKCPIVMVSAGSVGFPGVTPWGAATGVVFPVQWVGTSFLKITGGCILIYVSPVCPWLGSCVFLCLRSVVHSAR